MDDPLKKLGQSTQKIVQCRICKGDHWTTKCPYKDRLEVIQAQVKEDEAKQPAAGAGNASLLHDLHVLSITLILTCITYLYANITLDQLCLKYHKDSTNTVPTITEITQQNMMNHCFRQC